MSCTSLYELYKTKVNLISQLRNGHGSGPAIWSYISIKVFGKEFYGLDADNFWPAYKSDKLDDDEKIVLLSTYDRAFIEVDKLPEFALSCRKLHEVIIEDTEWTWNHFDDIADTAEEIAEYHDHRCKGMAIGCTSVCDIWEQKRARSIASWGVYEKLEDMKEQGYEK